MRIQCAIKLSFYYVNNICTVQLTRVQTDMGFVCELLWLIRLKCQSMTKFGMMLILQAHVCGCISAHPGFPDQKMKRETGDA